MSARVLLLLMKLIFPLMGLLGYLAFDFWNVNRMARFGDGDGVTVGEYIGGWVSLGQAIGSSSAADGPPMPTELADMLPKAPEGWTRRPSEPSDIDAFMPADGNEKLTKYVRAVVNPRDGNGTKDVRLTYENGPRRVVFELVRYPNFIFTSFGAMQLKMNLQMTSAQYGGRNFMTVRGMEITEDLLPEEVGLRYFFGSVGSQIWVRVLATRSMTDQELLPFFETLHVPAMNADVVDKQSGMGELPIIVLVSALDEDRRVARAELQATETKSRAQEREKRNAERAAEKAAREQDKEDRANGIERDVDSGVILRKGAGADKKKPKKTKAGFGDDGCTVEGGRKICGTEPEVQD